MKPASRIQASIEILGRIETSPVPMDSVIGDYMRQRRYIGSKDRAEIAERSYNIMRSSARLNWWCTSLQLENTARIRMILFLSLAEGIADKRFKDLFDGSKYAPEELSEKELFLLETLKTQFLNHPDMPVDIVNECPPEHLETLQNLFSENFENEMQAMQKSATLDLRVNTFLCTREKARAYLEADGIETEETALSPFGLRCKKKSYLARSKAFNKGWVEIQDEGSQMIAALCDPKPGMQVLDYCAGAGGKTLALAAMMERKGRIVAMDNDERRLNKGRDRYKKAGLADIIEVRCIEDDKNKKWLKRQKGKFDLVLLDVPCSGTGTWRRNPDMKWRTYGPELDELLKLQAEIMDKIVHTLKPGGRLVYATCSLLSQENEEQVEAFLKRHEGFEIEPVSKLSFSGLTGESITSNGSSASAEDDEQAYKGNFMRLTPYQHKTDGFFAAILSKL